MSARPRHWVSVLATNFVAQVIDLCSEANHNHSRTACFPLAAPSIPTSVGEWHRLV